MLEDLPAVPKVFTSKPLAVLIACLILLFAVHELWVMAPFVGARYARVDGRVTHVELHKHSFVRSTYSLDGKDYTIERGGDVSTYENESLIPIFYRLDRPEVASYSESDFSYGNAAVVVLGFLFLEGVVVFFFKLMALGADKKPR